MSALELFVFSVAVYAGIPLLIAVQRSAAQMMLFYAHIASVLTLGGLLGAVYVLPLRGDVAVLAGQVSYGAFMFSTLITVIVGRDVRVVRTIVLLTVYVDVLVYLIFKVTHLALSQKKVPDPLGVARWSTGRRAHRGARYCRSERPRRGTGPVCNARVDERT